jgi:hypothetical protein
MIAAGNTYHYVGSLNARLLLATRPNPSGKQRQGATSRLALQAQLSLRA